MAVEVAAAWEAEKFRVLGALGAVWALSEEEEGVGERDCRIDEDIVEV